MTYWCDRCLTVRVEGPDGQRTVQLEQPFARIGSEAGCDVRLEGEGIPKLGSYLHATDCGIFLLPLTDETSDDNSQGRWLAEEDVIEVGQYRLSVSFADDSPLETDGALLDTKGSSESPVPVIVVLVDRERRAMCRLYRGLTLVGRRRPSAMRLKSEHVSSVHCMLYWQDERLWVIDLLSRNGTKKRNKRFDVETLGRGQTINLGDVYLGMARTSKRTWSEQQKRLQQVFNLRPPHVSADHGDGSSVDSASGLSSMLEDESAGEHEPGFLDLKSESSEGQVESITDMLRQLDEQKAAWESERADPETRIG